jgi:hypothetical protein
MEDNTICAWGDTPYKMKDIYNDCKTNYKRVLLEIHPDKNRNCNAFSTEVFKNCMTIKEENKKGITTMLETLITKLKKEISKLEEIKKSEYQRREFEEDQRRKSDEERRKSDEERRKSDEERRKSDEERKSRIRGVNIDYIERYRVKSQETYYKYIKDAGKLLRQINIYTLKDNYDKHIGEIKEVDEEIKKIRDNSSVIKQLYSSILETISDQSLKSKANQEKIKKISEFLDITQKLFNFYDSVNSTISNLKNSLETNLTFGNDMSKLVTDFTIEYNKCNELLAMSNKYKNYYKDLETRLKSMSAECERKMSIFADKIRLAHTEEKERLVAECRAEIDKRTDYFQTEIKRTVESLNKCTQELSGVKQMVSQREQSLTQREQLLIQREIQWDQHLVVVQRQLNDREQRLNDREQRLNGIERMTID